MSDKFKEQVKAARRAKDRCTAFKWMSMLSGAAAILIGIIALIMPPSWQVDDSVLKLIAEFMGIQAMFEAMVALEAGVDAKVAFSKDKGLEVKTDANGDGKTID